MSSTGAAENDRIESNEETTEPRPLDSDASSKDNPIHISPSDETDQNVSDDEDSNDVLSLRKLLEEMEDEDEDSADLKKLSTILGKMSKDQINSVLEGASKRTALHMAAARGLAMVVEKLLNAGADIEVMDHHYETALWIACVQGHISAVKVLLKGSDDAHVVIDGLSLLDIAIQQQYLELVDILLQRKVILDPISYRWVNPLDLAIAGGSKRIMERLVQEDENRNILLNTPHGGRTSLGEAAYRGNLEKAQILIELGASLDALDDDGETALHRAVYGEEQNMVEFLLRHKLNINAKNENGRTALHMTTRFVSGYREETILRMLLNHNADATVQDDEGKTALHMAATYREFDIVKILLEHNSDIDLRDNDGKTALHCALFDTNEDIIKILLEYKPQIDLPDTQGQTALHYAVRFCAADIAEALIDNGANLGTKTNTGETALHLAAKRNSETFNMCLRKMKWSDIFIEDETGQTALCVAFEGDTQIDVGSQLLQKLEVLEGPDQANLEYEALIWAAKSSNRHDLAKLIFSKPSRTGNSDASKNRDGWSAIEWAAHKKLPAVLWLLIAKCTRTSETEERVNSAKNLLGMKPTKEPKKEPGKEPPQDLSAEPKKDLDRDFDEKPEKPPKKRLTTECENQDDHERGAHGAPNLGGSIHTRWSICSDILKDPPFATIYNNDRPFEYPKLKEPTSKTLIEFEAAMVQFYKKGNIARTTRRFRSIKDVIYDDTLGPKKIMDDAAETAKKIMGFIPNPEQKSLANLTPQESSAHTEPKFMWIHLPATNMEWMNDLLKRIMKDEKFSADEFREVSGFLQDSWVEVPDKTSAARIMRPRYVSGNVQRGKVEGGQKGNNGQSEQDKGVHEDIISVAAIYAAYLSEIVEKKHWPLIRVNQLWVWTIDNKWLITATTHPVDSTNDLSLPVILDHLKSRVDAGGSRFQPDSTAEMSKLLVSLFISFYEKEQKFCNHQSPITPQDGNRKDESHGDKASIRQIFSKSVNRMGRDETELFEEFEGLMIELTDQSKEGSHSENATMLWDVKIQAFARRARELLADIKDIRDEFNILKSIANHQKTVQKEMAGDTKKIDGLAASYVVDDIEEMDKIADRIQSLVNSTLSLQQNEVANFQAGLSLRHSEIANRQADLSVEQGKTLMVFTVVTIIFAPLSFLPSLFALDVKSFQEAPAWALWIIFCVPVFVFGPPAFLFVYWESAAPYWYKIISTFNHEAPNSASEIEKSSNISSSETIADTNTLASVENSMNDAGHSRDPTSTEGGTNGQLKSQAKIRNDTSVKANDPRECKKSCFSQLLSPFQKQKKLSPDVEQANLPK